MIGQILCALGFHLAPDDKEGRRFLWFCRRQGCKYLHAAELEKRQR